MTFREELGTPRQDYSQKGPQEERRQHWEDALGAFGASLIITERWDERIEELCYRIRVKGLRRVSGKLLVEIDNNRQEILRLFAGVDSFAGSAGEEEVEFSKAA